jgi:integrase
MRETKSSKKYPGVHWRETKRKGKSYFISYYVDGKLQRERIGTEAEKYTAALAATVRANRVQAIRHNKDLPRDPKSMPTYGEIATRYLEWSVAHKKSHARDTSLYNKYLAALFATLRPTQIRPLDLERLQTSLMSTALSPASVRHVLACFRAIWNKGREWGMINGESPTSKLKLPRPDNSRERALTNDETASLLDALQIISPVSHGLALMALNTGARRGELFAITWADVDLEGRNLVLRNTKNGKTRRIPLNDAAYDYLEKHRVGSSKTVHVFTQANGQPVRYLSSAFQRSADKLFNPKGTNPRYKVVFHTLRHTFISNLVSKGVPLTVVQELVGHSSLAMLQRYSHLSPGALRNAVDLINE